MDWSLPCGMLVFNFRMAGEVESTVPECSSRCEGRRKKPKAGMGEAKYDGTKW